MRPSNARQELCFGVWVIRVHESSGVHLNLFQINRAGADGHAHFLAVACAVLAVGCGKGQGVGTVFGEKTFFGEVGGVTTCGEDDGSVGRFGLAFVFELDADDGARVVLKETGHSGLAQGLDTLRFVLGQGVGLVHEGVGDHHARKLGIAAVCAGLRVTTKTRDFGEVEVKVFLQPVDGFTRAAGQTAIGKMRLDDWRRLRAFTQKKDLHLDQIISCEIACLTKKSILSFIVHNIGTTLDEGL